MLQSQEGGDLTRILEVLKYTKIKRAFTNARMSHAMSHLMSRAPIPPLVDATGSVTIGIRTQLHHGA